MTNLTVTVLILLAAFSTFFAGVWYLQTYHPTPITTFEDCMYAGYPIMESYPAQCQTPDGRTFVQEIESAPVQNNLIRLTTPQPGQKVTNPLTVTGTARGAWFFEASFPLRLDDDSGTTIATTSAQAEGEWMTNEFVPFQAELNIPPGFSGPAILILEKSNPSGLPANADSLEIPLIVLPSEKQQP